MKKPAKPLSKGNVLRRTGVTKRKLEINPETNAPFANPILGLSRQELIALVAILQAQVLAMHSELSLQHEKSNQALRLLGSNYQFMFGITFAYIAALQNFRDAGNNKPIPAYWLAARVTDAFESYFENFDLTRLDIGPNADLLRNLYAMANRKLNPGSKLADYVGIKEKKPVQADDGKAKDKN